MEENIIKNIVKELESKLKNLEEKSDEFSKEELKIIFIDVMDSLIFIYNVVIGLPKEIVKYIEKESNEFYDKRIKEKKDLDKDSSFYT